MSKFSLVCSKHFTETKSESFTLCKDEVSSLFDVEKCVYVFNDSTDYLII